MNLSQLAVDAAKGAAAGSVVPGVGTALGAVGGIALDLAPEIGRWLFGADAGPTIAAVKGAVEAVTGTDHSQGQLAALGDPETAASLRLQLAQIAADRASAADEATQARLAAQLANVADARAQTIALAQAGSGIAWGAPIVSVVVLVSFGAALLAVLMRALPDGSADVANVMLGTLGAMATSVVGYWVGSSAGSARKDARLASLVEHSGNH